jgi:hypothetical protein
MTRLLAAVIESLARLGDPAVCRFANVTGADDAWDDYGYHHPPKENP